jgi:hypothetical protein
MSSLAAIGDYGASVREWIRLSAGGRLRQPSEYVGARLTFADGTTSRVFRETRTVDVTTVNPTLLVIAFRLTFLGDLHPLHAGFRHECVLHTPLFAGFRGFRSKLWLDDEHTQVYRGVYQWDGEDDAVAYARRMVGLLAPFSNRHSARFRIVPGLSRLDYLHHPDASANGTSDGWWRLARFEARPAP